MENGMERRALLLHLGDVLESIACVSRVKARYGTLSEAIAEEDSLADFTILRGLGELAPDEYVKLAARAYFLWPKLLLDEELNRALLANLVQNDLFAGNQAG